MSFSHLLIFALILIIFVPPEKLPEVVRNIARFFNQLRGASSGLWDELKREAAVKPEDLYQYKPQPAPKAAQSVTNSSETQSIPATSLDSTNSSTQTAPMINQNPTNETDHGSK